MRNANLILGLAFGLLALCGCPRGTANQAGTQQPPAQVNPPVVAPEFPAETEAMTPMPAPEISFVLADGTAKQLSEYRGTPLVLNFWAEW